MARRALAAMVLLAALIGVAPPIVAEPSEATSKRALIVFDVANDHRLAEGYARQLQSLLGHFALSAIDLEPIAGYARGDVDRYDVLFFIGSARPSRLPAEFLKDVWASGKTVCWLNRGLDELARSYDPGQRFGWTYLGEEARPAPTVVYRGTRLEKGDPVFSALRIVDPQKAAVLAVTEVAGATFPYIVRSGNWWVIADNPLAYAGPADRYLAFADVLHDVLDENHPPRHSAVIRIEDVSPLTKAEQLRAIADLLSAEHVPFVVALIPFYVDPRNDVRVALSERPDVVAALQYMVARGGTVALHGSSHQYKGETGVDFEFWDATRQGPIGHDTEGAVRDRIEAALAETFRSGIYPVLWETPHYAASSLDYAALARHFTTAIEQRLALDDPRTSFYFPFFVRRDAYGQQIIPENLGYVPLASPTVDHLLRAARANLVVRDGFASAFFHPFVEVALLRQLVRGVKELGYTYLDVKTFANVVRAQDKAVVTGKADVKLSLAGHYLREYVFDDHGALVEERGGSRKLWGEIERKVDLKPGWLYAAHGALVSAPSFWERQWRRAKSIVPTFGTRPRAVGREPNKGREGRAVVLWVDGADGVLARDQEGLWAALTAVGLETQKMDVETYVPDRGAPINLVAIPQAAASRLTKARISGVLTALRRGTNLIAVGRSPLAAALGIDFTGNEVRVRKMRDRVADATDILWPRAASLPEFIVPPGAEVLVEADGSRTPVAISASLGSGRYMYFGSLFTEGGHAYERFPYLTHHVRRQFGLAPRLRSDNLEVFFDPGFRPNISVEQLVVTWRHHGVRAIHAAAWAFYPRYAFDYARLIRSAHANGMLVYAWFELPHLTEDFWIKRPACREKTNAGRDARSEWRFPLALTDSACVAAVEDEVRRILQVYEWDGVNFAELNFESAVGLRDPGTLTPFHPSARLDFQQRYGFDPARLFDQRSTYFWRANPTALRRFEEFRVEWVVRLHERFLSLADAVARSRPHGFETIVTVLDSLSAPELRRSIAIDVTRILKLRDRYDFTVAVEDPQAMWGLPPERYERIGRIYRTMVSDPRRLLIDVNVVPFRASGTDGFATAQQTGVELHQLLRSAVRHADRVLLYAESTIFPWDLDAIPYALGSVARKQGEPGRWIIEAPSPVVLEVGDDVDEVLLDGRLWPAFYRGAAIIPRGRHEVTVREGISRYWGRPQGLRILKVTADLLWARTAGQDIEFEYETFAPALVVVNARPDKIVVDGRAEGTSAVPGDDGYAILLPRGRHVVALHHAGGVAGVIRVLGFWTSVGVVWLGILGGSLLVSLRLHHQVVRRARRGGR